MPRNAARPLSVGSSAFGIVFELVLGGAPVPKPGHAGDEIPQLFKDNPKSAKGLLRRFQPLTAPAVKPLTICLWKINTRKNNGAVIDTAAATATT